MKSILAKATLFSLFLVISTQTLLAQETKTVSLKEFSFDYPADWKLIDKSSEKSQQFNLMPSSGNVLIMLISFPNKVSTYDEFNNVRAQSTQSISDRIYRRFNRLGQARKESVCTSILKNDIPGDRVTGAYDENPSTADMFYFAANEKFFGLIYLRDDAESSNSDPVWNNLIKSFSFKNFNYAKPDLIIDIGSDEVLNSRATKLSRPLFPSDIQFSTEVTLRVIIDETGKVIWAKGIYGSSSNFPYAISAAKDSKFKPPMICGKPGKLSGLINYRFIRRE